MASSTVECPNCRASLTIPEPTPRNTHTEPSKVIAEFFRRFHAGYIKRFGDRKTWASDLATVFLVRPERIRGWEEGQGEPNAAQLERFRLLLDALEAGKPLRMQWSESVPDAERARQFYSVGITWIQFLGCNDAKRECKAVRALKGIAHDITTAPNLPLPNCDKLECLCIILASEGPKGRRP